MMERRCCDNQIGLRESVAGLAAVFHQEPPLEHDFFRDRQNTLLEHRPYLVREPVIEFGSLGRIGHDLDPELYFGERYSTDVKQFERWTAMNATTLRSGFGRRSSDKTLISSSQAAEAQEHLARALCWHTLCSARLRAAKPARTVTSISRNSGGTARIYYSKDGQAKNSLDEVLSII
jgi:hypothetical protein